MVKALKPFHLDGLLPTPSVTPDSPLPHRLAWCAKAEVETGAVIAALSESAPVAANVISETVVIDDGNSPVTLYVSRPTARAGRLPCIVHLHGGGMAFGSATQTCFERWRTNLAATGLVVVGVEFRNSAGKLGVHPYPAGLDDCAAAVRWAAAHRDDLGASHIVVSGESGGANLSLTVAHRAKREGWLADIAGVYAQCPYISNQWLEQPDELPSLKENDGYFVSCMQAAILGSLYDPDGENTADPTCWAANAGDDDLAGMPPHVVSVNELDPLRDEGLVYYRRLLRAGVPAVGRVVAGTSHGADVLAGGIMPEVYGASLRDVSGFAHSLAK